MEEKVQLSGRVRRIIEEHVPEGDFVKQTLDFVRKVLAPESVGEKHVQEKEIKHYDMQYRYDHTLRVAAIGRKIARGEGIPEEPLIMACLLHDVGYPECSCFEELDRHPAFGEEIAGRFLQKIGYDERMGRSICKAIRIHDKNPYEGEDATPLELSVRDADDIDRMDAMRLCTWGYHDIGQRAAWEIRDICKKRLVPIRSSVGRLCGTATAKRIWIEKQQLQEDFYRKLLEQMELGEEIENYGMFYHASPNTDLQMLLPHPSNHGIPFVYLSEKRENVLVYLSNAIEKYCRETGFSHEGAWSKWGPYGFDKDGVLHLEEYYPDALADTYKGVSGYIYKAGWLPGMQRLQDIPYTVVSQEPVEVISCEYVPDAYEAIMEAAAYGKIMIELYGDITENKREWIRKKVAEEYGQAAGHPEYRHFLEGKFGHFLSGTP